MAKTAPSPSDDRLPVPLPSHDPVDAEARPDPDVGTDHSRLYLEIRPSNEALHPGAVAQAMRLLYDVLENTTRVGLINWIRRRSRVPRVEWLLVSDGRPDPTIRYLVTSDYLDLVEDLEGVLRTCLPNTYEFSVVEWHPDRLVDEMGYDPVAVSERDVDDRDGPQHPSIVEGHPYVAGVEYRGRAKLSRDWQTPLQAFDAVVDPGPGADRASVSTRIPLASVIEAMRDAEVPVLYQVVLRALPDWSSQADEYVYALRTGRIGLWRFFWDVVFVPTQEDVAAYEPSMADAERIEGIRNRTPRWSFAVSARAAALTYEAPSRADAVARRLSNVLGHLSGPTHEIRGHVSTDDELHPGTPLGRQIFEAIRTMTAPLVSYALRRNHLPWRAFESAGIVVTAEELPGFCLVDGAGLTPNGRRALAARHGERTGLALPTPDQLDRYFSTGQAIGMPLTHDHQPLGRPLSIPPEDQDRHSIVIGPTGAGKTVLMLTAMLTNVEATSGPEILFDHKGGGTSMEYLQMHYRRYGHIDDVYYFDCTRVLPAISVLDIGPLLRAGVPHEEARSRVAGHYEEISATLMGPDRYYQAVEAPKTINNHVRALFDPVHGEPAVAHSDLVRALMRTLQDGAPPPVTDDRLADAFASLLDRDRDVFNRVLGAALNRVELIETDGRLAPIFDHVPEPGEPHFDFETVLDEDVVVIFDFGGMEPRAKRAITLALLSTLWRALQARATSAPDAAERALVNCYLEEAGSLADSAIMDLLLSQGRSFGLSVMLGVQFLSQLNSANPRSRTDEEALNETATLIAGQVAVRDDLVAALATDDMPADRVDRRLSRMPRGEWLVRPGTAFGAESVRPVLMTSLPVPGGHPASDEPLRSWEREAFEEDFDWIREWTEDTFGLPQAEPHPPVVPEAEEVVPAAPRLPIERLDIALPHTKRIPKPVYFNDDTRAVHCLFCDTRYDPDSAGMRRAIACCSSMENVDRDDIPICALNLKLSPTEREESGLSDHQLMFLQAVYNAQQGRYEPFEYDLTRDSMIRLQEYVGIDPEEVDALLEAGLVRKDTDYPHRLYSVTPDGRATIGESYREGIDYGHGRGDLEESAQHVMGVILGTQFLETEYAADPDSPVTTVQAYHDIGGNQRLDIAGLDEAGEIVVAVEVERVNHDVARAVPEDFDKLAACAPQAAIWIAMSHSEAHQILAALNDPLEGEPRVTKTYATSTPANDFLIDEPGFTAIYTVDQLRDRLGID